MKEKYIREIKDICLLKNNHGADMYPADCTIHVYMFHSLVTKQSCYFQRTPLCEQKFFTEVNTFPARIQYRLIQ